jgi:hypothetical protein
MVEKLAEAKVRILRIGHPARLLPSVLQHYLDLIKTVIKFIIVV